jgi:hypothetical protein
VEFTKWPALWYCIPTRLFPQIDAEAHLSAAVLYVYVHGVCIQYRICRRRCCIYMYVHGVGIQYRICIQPRGPHRAVGLAVVIVGRRTTLKLI